MTKRDEDITGHGGARPGAGRPKGAKTSAEHRHPLPRTERVFASVHPHVLSQIEEAVSVQLPQTTTHAFLSDLLDRRFRCSCDDCKAARRALRERDRREKSPDRG